MLRLSRKTLLALEAVIDAVLAANQKSVEEFRAGKEKAFNALGGQAMKARRGKGNPAAINDLLRTRWPAVPVRESELQDEDWSEGWKAHFKPLRVGNVLVRPAWRTVKLRPGDVEVVLQQRARRFWTSCASGAAPPSLPRPSAPPVLEV